MSSQNSFSLIRAMTLAGCAAIFLAGCASDPATRPAAGNKAHQASEIASSMVGKPYRYGGNSPRGFDCSGLVHYSYRNAGISVPRSTNTQRAQSRRVSRTSIQTGDLLFFNQEGKYSSHVGIYLGNNRFVHAPSSGKRVRVDSLSDQYWQKNFVDARRF